MKTPLKDAWSLRLHKLHSEICEYKTRPEKLEIGCAIGTFKNNYGCRQTGLIVKINPKSVVIETPYGGWGEADFIDIMKFTIKKTEIEFIQTSRDRVNSPHGE